MQAPVPMTRLHQAHIRSIFAMKANKDGRKQLLKR
jgi:hypothetical protein